jgi:hypothetical protein
MGLERPELSQFRYVSIERSEIWWPQLVAARWHALGKLSTELFSQFDFFLSTLSDLPAGTAGTGTAGRRVRRAWVDGFFFQNRTLSVSYSCPSRIHGYRYRGTRARIDGYGICFFCCFCFTNIFFILECRKIWIISFRLSTNLNVHFKSYKFYQNSMFDI